MRQVALVAYCEVEQWIAPAVAEVQASVRHVPAAMQHIPRSPSHFQVLV